MTALSKGAGFDAPTYLMRPGRKRISTPGLSWMLVVPPSGACTGRQERNDRRLAQLGRFVSLLHPRNDALPIGRIHPANARPWLAEAVFKGAEEGGAFCVLGKRAYVQREAEFQIERTEYLRRRPPALTGAAIVHLIRNAALAWRYA